jgi:hypothetical protein
MNARPMIAAHARRVVTSGALVLVASLLVLGVSIGSEGDGSKSDLVSQAAWLEQHFRCEHHAELAAGQPIDLVSQVAWLEQHFRCEHHAELAEV